MLQHRRNGQGRRHGNEKRIYLAIDAFRARHDFDEPYANPLPKIYKERKDDSEKARFAIPKKHSFHKDGEKGGNAGANGANA